MGFGKVNKRKGVETLTPKPDRRVKDGLVSLVYVRSEVDGAGPRGVSLKARLG